jgi:hypothetical protein
MEIERVDNRKLEPAARDQLRKTAVRMHRQGLKQAAIADALGVRRSASGSERFEVARAPKRLSVAEVSANFVF